jgi:predicted nuclease of restriction endonuclease-like (RecB) superfamily
MIIIQQHSFGKLIDNVYQTHCFLKLNAIKAINQNLTIRNWLIGYYIVEFEQNGEDRAKYGTHLLEKMAKEIKSKGLKGLDTQSLRICRTFYSTYPQLAEIAFQKIENLNIAIRGLPSRELPEAQEAYPISNELLLSRLSYSHFVELLGVKEPLERLFYEVETIKNNWSVKELERAFNTALYVRTGLSTNKEAVLAKFKNQKPNQVMDIMRDPYFFEFLGLEERSDYSESDLEQAILNQLQQFLIELGTGFCFEARQKRITFDNTHYRIDLVFYHRILKSHILIDLKIGKFDHSDAGQMNVYLNYYKENETQEGDNPPIGLILCGDKSETLAKYATAGMDNQLFVSNYLVKLPEKKMLEDFIRRELDKKL